jgi:hypothetical protein
MQVSSYALFLGELAREVQLTAVLFGPLYEVASAAFHLRAEAHEVAAVWTILLLTILASGALGLANTGITVAVERDWCVYSWSHPDL